MDPNAQPELDTSPLLDAAEHTLYKKARFSAAHKRRRCVR